MILGIVSDSHGDVPRLKRFLREVGPVDAILHAGDFYEDSKKLSGITKAKVIGVMGNCDYLMTGPLEKVVEVSGKKVLLAHGHQYGVKRDREALKKRAVSLGVDAVVFGHTHVAETFWAGDVLFVNPGSCHYGRGSHGPSYGTLEITPDGGMVASIHYLE